LPADTVQPYDGGFEDLAAGWERVAFEAAHAAALTHVPAKLGLVFDIGAGSGRDAAWFAAKGWAVVAVEPADRLRRHAQALHPSPSIAWEADRLPGLEKLLKRGVLADLIWLSAVWMHVAPADRRRAFRKLVTLLKPGGRLIMSLRQGPLPFDRPMHAVTSDEVERLAIEHGLNVRAVTQSADAAGRADITWTGIVLDLPDDATGALPLVRGIILQDAKSATYKLALLRVIARIADQSASFARYEENHVELPLGLVALYWLRMFKRLVEEDIPQAPGHRGRAGLGFVKHAFWAMGVASPFELRPGATFAAPRSHAITDIAKVDVDHCFPFAAWPCDDLWNLMPTTRRINNEKRDKLVTLDLLQRAESRIGDWWKIAYRDGRFTQRMTRFEEEARGTLPIEEPSPPTTTEGPGLAFAHDSRFFPEHATATLPSDAILEAMRYQRLRLHQDQQLPEWQGPRHKA
jgi:SAM-dependent methyltransferase